jgi:hypothetical protein
MNKIKAVAWFAGMRTTTDHTGVSTQFDFGPLKAHPAFIFSINIFIPHDSKCN